MLVAREFSGKSPYAKAERGKLRESGTRSHHLATATLLPFAQTTAGFHPSAAPPF
jgi:hypothetical protein